jgi:hypothetical protein
MSGGRDAILNCGGRPRCRTCRRCRELAAVTREPEQEFKPLPIQAPNALGGFSLHAKPPRRGENLSQPRDRPANRQRARASVNQTGATAAACRTSDLLAPFSGAPRRFVSRYRPPAPPPLRPCRQHRYDHEHHCEGDEDGERRIDLQRWKEKSDDKAQQDDADYSTRLDHPDQYDPSGRGSLGHHFRGPAPESRSKSRLRTTDALPKRRVL